MNAYAELGWRLLYQVRNKGKCVRLDFNKDDGSILASHMTKQRYQDDGHFRNWIKEINELLSFTFLECNQSTGSWYTN